MCQLKMFAGLVSIFALFLFFAINYQKPTLSILAFSFTVWFFWRLSGLICEIRRMD